MPLWILVDDDKIITQSCMTIIQNLLKIIIYLRKNVIHAN